MKIVKLLDDTKTLRKIHGWLTIMWFIAAFPICLFLSESVPFLVFISVYAVVASHWAAWDAVGAQEAIEKK